MTAPETNAPNLLLEGTPYFRPWEGQLRRYVRLRLPLAYAGRAQVRVEVEGRALQADVDVAEGQVLAPGPAAWDGPVACRAELTCEAGHWQGEATLAPTRPWTIYVAQDKHLDYGWIHPVEEVAERMNTLLDYHLDQAARTGLRWNLDVSAWAEEYLQARPSARRERLLAALRSGQMELGALWLVPFPGTMGVEEWLQTLYPARRLEEAHGVPLRTVSLQEVPSAPWGLAEILAGAGFRHVVKGAYHLRNPHLGEREPWPLMAWEGPGGGRVLLRWDLYKETRSWGGYAEAYPLWLSAGRDERVRFIEETIARYDRYADYPCAAILLAGTGHDGYPQTTVVSEFIAWFNAQGWSYPRLVDATWSQYWEQVERELSQTSRVVPVVRGDWGSTWEEWPAQLAHLNTVYRRARETTLAAQSLSALAYAFDPLSHPARREALAAAWRGLLQFADHNIGGASPAMADDMRDRKAMYAYSAGREAARALDGALAALATGVAPTPEGERHFLVANPDSWAHGGLVEVTVPEPGPYGLVDVESGASLPCQLCSHHGWPDHRLTFLAGDVPAFGYRRYALRPGPGSAALREAEPCGLEIASPHFRLAVDPETGALRSLVDLASGRELVDGGQGYGLNEYLQHSAGALHRPRLASTGLKRGPVMSAFIVEVESLRARLRTTYYLYESLGRLDIENALTREPSDEPQAGWFAFPFAVAGGGYRYDGPAAILRPGLQAEGGDLLPGAGRTCIAVQSFVAALGAHASVVLATPDASLVQLGPQVLADPAADSDAQSGLLLSLAMHNLTRNDRAVDQGGQARFSFRYSIVPVLGAFRPSMAVRLAGEAARTLPATWVTDGACGRLDASSGSLLSLEPTNVVATGLKVAEDGQGWMLRLWECDGVATEVAVDLRGLGATRAWQADLLERRGEPLPLEGGSVRLSVPARSLRALRFA